MGARAPACYPYPYRLNISRPCASLWIFRGPLRAQIRPTDCPKPPGPSSTGKRGQGVPGATGGPWYSRGRAVVDLGPGPSVSVYTYSSIYVYTILAKYIALTLILYLAG